MWVIIHTANLTQATRTIKDVREKKWLLILI